MVIAAGGNKRGLSPIPLRQFKAEDAAVKPNRPFQVRDLQVDVSNADAGMN